ncbi:MAG: hypothetical protein HQL08_10660 [Nitrospirae bacterium]|nr:hypothetical protein [Nitrospirota bacterium]
MSGKPSFFVDEDPSKINKFIYDIPSISVEALLENNGEKTIVLLPFEPRIGEMIKNKMLRKYNPSPNIEFVVFNRCRDAVSGGAS